MSDGMTVKLKGADNLARTLRQFGDNLDAPESLDAIGVQLAAAGRFAAPRQSGRLAASVGSETVRGRVTVYADTPYAAAITYGIGPRAGMPGPHNIDADPFLERAADSTEPAWSAAYADQIQRNADKVRGM